MSASYSAVRYYLKLANGSTWNFLATGDAEPWLQRLASTMGLHAGEAEGTTRVVLASRETAGTGQTGPGDAADAWPPKSAWNAIGSGYRTLLDMTEITYHINPNDTYANNMFRMWSLAFFIGQMEQSSGSLFCHAGLVEKDGKGVLLAASGGTGKSTCCRRIPAPWQALADDQVLVLAGKEAQYRVHPMPTWSEFLRGCFEKVWNVGDSYPLAAVFFLQQGETDEVEPLPQWQAAACIYKAAVEAGLIGLLGMDRDEQRLYKERLFNNACKLARAVPGYNLKVSLNGKFWKEIDKTIRACSFTNNLLSKKC
jgi:SynChlorMet cassette protein ScmC